MKEPSGTPGGSFIWCAVRSLCEVRTVDIGLKGIPLEKSTPELDAPTEILRTVPMWPGRLAPTQ
jgi:hypothetical protein